MKKINTMAILSLIIYILTVSPKLSRLDVKSYASPSYQAEPYHIFLPIVTITKILPEYFVAPSGRDTNPGSFLQPWKTISKAAQMVRPGVTVYIRDGIYPEAVSFTISGTQANPIRVKAYPGENPMIDGSFSERSGYLLNIDGDYIQVTGLEIRDSAGRGILIDGNYDLVDNVYVHHSKSAGIFISNGHHSTVQNSRVWRNSLTNEYEQATGWSSGLSAARNGVTYAMIRNNVVWENWGEGISSFEADHTTIENNISHDNFSANIYISDSTNALCQSNYVFTDPSSYVYPYGSHAGIMMGDERYTPPSANITIINNVAFGNHGNFWWWQGVQGGGMNNVLIAYNTFVNGIGDPNRGRGGVIISRGDHQGVRFENNLIQQDGELPVIATVDQPGITYSHNLWSKLPYSAVNGPGDIIADPRLAKTGTPYAVVWFKLTALSPAIDKALLIPGILVDYFNKPRGGTPDIGAIEYIP